MAMIIDPKTIALQIAAREAEYWEQLRHHAAIAALQGMLANSNQLDFRKDARYRDESRKLRPMDMAEDAVNYANALIHRLKLSDEEYAELKNPYRE